MWPCGRQQTALVLKMGLWSQFGGGYCSFPTRNTFKPFRSRPLISSKVGLAFQWHASYLHFFILLRIFVTIFVFLELYQCVYDCVNLRNSSPQVLFSAELG